MSIVRKWKNSDCEDSDSNGSEETFTDSSTQLNFQQARKKLQEMRRQRKEHTPTPNRSVSADLAHIWAMVQLSDDSLDESDMDTLKKRKKKLKTHSITNTPTRSPLAEVVNQMMSPASTDDLSSPCSSPKPRRLKTTVLQPTGPKRKMHASTDEVTGLGRSSNDDSFDGGGVVSSSSSFCSLSKHHSVKYQQQNKENLYPTPAPPSAHQDSFNEVAVKGVPYGCHTMTKSDTMATWVSPCSPERDPKTGLKPAARPYEARPQSPTRLQPKTGEQRKNAVRPEPPAIKPQPPPGSGGLYFAQLISSPPGSPPGPAHPRGSSPLLSPTSRAANPLLCSPPHAVDKGNNHTSAHTPNTAPTASAVNDSLSGKQCEPMLPPCLNPSQSSSRHPSPGRAHPHQPRATHARLEHKTTMHPSNSHNLTGITDATTIHTQSPNKSLLTTSQGMLHLNVDELSDSDIQKLEDIRRQEQSLIEQLQLKSERKLVAAAHQAQLLMQQQQLQVDQLHMAQLMHSHSDASSVNVLPLQANGQSLLSASASVEQGIHGLTSAASPSLSSVPTPSTTITSGLSGSTSSSSCNGQPIGLPHVMQVPTNGAPPTTLYAQVDTPNGPQLIQIQPPPFLVMASNSTTAAATTDSTQQSVMDTSGMLVSMQPPTSGHQQQEQQQQQQQQPHIPRSGSGEGSPACSVSSRKSRSSGRTSPVTNKTGRDRNSPKPPSQSSKTTTPTDATTTASQTAPLQKDKKENVHSNNRHPKKRLSDGSNSKGSRSPTAGKAKDRTTTPPPVITHSTSSSGTSSTSGSGSSGSGRTTPVNNKSHSRSTTPTRNMTTQTMTGICEPEGGLAEMFVVPVKPIPKTIVTNTATNAQQQSTVPQYHSTTYTSTTTSSSSHSTSPPLFNVNLHDRTQKRQDLAKKMGIPTLPTADTASPSPNGGGGGASGIRGFDESVNRIRQAYASKSPLDCPVIGGAGGAKDWNAVEPTVPKPFNLQCEIRAQHREQQKPVLVEVEVKFGEGRKPVKLKIHPGDDHIALANNLAVAHQLDPHQHTKLCKAILRYMQDAEAGLLGCGFNHKGDSGRRTPRSRSPTTHSPLYRRMSAKEANTALNKDITRGASPISRATTHSHASHTSRTPTPPISSSTMQAVHRATQNRNPNSNSTNSSPLHRRPITPHSTASTNKTPSPTVSHASAYVSPPRRPPSLSPQHGQRAIARTPPTRCTPISYHTPLTPREHSDDFYPSGATHTTESSSRSTTGTNRDTSSTNSIGASPSALREGANRYYTSLVSTPTTAAKQPTDHTQRTYATASSSIQEDRPPNPTISPARNNTNTTTGTTVTTPSRHTSPHHTTPTSPSSPVRIISPAASPRHTEPPQPVSPTIRGDSSNGFPTSTVTATSHTIAFGNTGYHSLPVRSPPRSVVYDKPISTTVVMGTTPPTTHTLHRDPSSLTGSTPSVGVSTHHSNTAAVSNTHNIANSSSNNHTTTSTPVPLPLGTSTPTTAHQTSIQRPSSGTSPFRSTTTGGSYPHILSHTNTSTTSPTNVNRHHSSTNSTTSPVPYTSASTIHNPNNSSLLQGGMAATGGIGGGRGVSSIPHGLSTGAFGSNSSPTTGSGNVYFSSLMSPSSPPRAVRVPHHTELGGGGGVHNSSVPTVLFNSTQSSGNGRMSPTTATAMMLGRAAKPFVDPLHSVGGGGAPPCSSSIIDKYKSGIILPSNGVLAMLNNSISSNPNSSGSHMSYPSCNDTLFTTNTPPSPTFSLRNMPMTGRGSTPTSSPPKTPTVSSAQTPSLYPSISNSIARTSAGRGEGLPISTMWTIPHSDKPKAQGYRTSAGSTTSPSTRKRGSMSPVDYLCVDRLEPSARHESLSHLPQYHRNGN